MALRDEKIKEQVVIKERASQFLLKSYVSQGAARSLQADSRLLLGHTDYVGHDELERKVTEMEDAIKAKSWVWDPELAGKQ